MNWNHIFLGAITEAFAGYGVFTIWPSSLARWSWLGGWLAAGIIITTGWWVNHYLGAMPNKNDGAWVDMALPIWLLNHGIGLLFEPQMSGNLPGPWSDQALACFWGLFVADLFAGKKFNWEVITTGILSGVLGGILLFATV